MDLYIIGVYGDCALGINPPKGHHDHEIKAKDGQSYLGDVIFMHIEH